LIVIWRSAPPPQSKFRHKPAAALFGFQNSREKFRQICKRKNNNP